MLGSILERLKQGLARTRDTLARRVRDLFSGFRTLNDEFLARLEETLITSDVGVEATRKIIEGLKEDYRKRAFDSPDDALAHLRRRVSERLTAAGRDLRFAPSGPTVILVVGVNGTGKTTSIAKLAHLLRSEGRSVLLAAGDTFRAAAVEQLTHWSERVGAGIVKHATGADPAAVVYDAAEAAAARKIDVLLVDTAGRLQTKANLMKELTKIRGVLERKIPGAPHETLLVLDAVTGQNALSQAQAFREATNVTGIFLAKMDGTARGGIVVAIQDRFGIPVKFVGLGEQPGDVARFDPEAFVTALLE